MYKKLPIGSISKHNIYGGVALVTTVNSMLSGTPSGAFRHEWDSIQKPNFISNSWFMLVNYHDELMHFSGDKNTIFLILYDANASR